MTRLLRPFWNLTRPVRAAVAARLDRIAYDASARAAAAHDPRPWLDGVLGAHIDKSEKQADEITLVLDAVVAEQFRLQEEVADLRRRLDAALATGAEGWR